jgi:hypothetical protein
VGEVYHYRSVSRDLPDDTLRRRVIVRVAGLNWIKMAQLEDERSLSRIGQVSSVVGAINDNILYISMGEDQACERDGCEQQRGQGLHFTRVVQGEGKQIAANSQGAGGALYC